MSRNIALLALSPICPKNALTYTNISISSNHAHSLTYVYVVGTYTLLHLLIHTWAQKKHPRSDDLTYLHDLQRMRKGTYNLKHAHMHTYTHAHIHTQTHTHIHVHTICSLFKNTCIYLQTGTRPHIHTNTHNIHTHTWDIHYHASTHTLATHTYKHILTHTHTHTHTPKHIHTNIHKLTHINILTCMTCANIILYSQNYTHR